MQTANDGLKIMDADRVGIMAAIPSHCIEGVMIHDLLKILTATMDDYWILTLLEDWLKIRWRMDISFAYRRVLKKLTPLIEIDLRKVDRHQTLDDDIFAMSLKFEAVSRGLWHIDIVPGFEFKHTVFSL